MIFDQAGNLYGTTQYGGDDSACNVTGCGTVFQLTPSGKGWAENTLHRFQNGSDGAFPYAGLISDQSGNLYGATTVGGTGGGGAAFELTGGSFTFNLLYNFPGQCISRCGPLASLAMDNGSNLYGTAIFDGAYGAGSVFKLTPSDGGWTYTSFHDFTGGSDGGEPDSSMAFDASGNLYGTTVYGGTGGSCSSGCGVVWEITP